MLCSHLFRELAVKGVEARGVEGRGVSLRLRAKSAGELLLWGWSGVTVWVFSGGGVGGGGHIM